MEILPPRYSLIVYFIRVFILLPFTVSSDINRGWFCERNTSQAVGFVGVKGGMGRGVTPRQS